ncbi:hypothetical protein DPMN_073861 [Dreissena polymorpha]|uniref:Uncharacterized protein n=1 Tax=Dreissena polymorpha TaxID=45954 RepID=A0A9D3YF75_DREPO|nr:hypothetical protein DPMN_073861 [Dreissena polymorpha]
MQFRWSKTIQFRSRPFDVPLPRMKDHNLCPVVAIFHAAQSTRQADANGPAFVFSVNGLLKPLRVINLWLEYVSA